jgi:hypothetical protein
MPFIAMRFRLDNFRKLYRGRVGSGFDKIIRLNEFVMLKGKCRFCCRSKLLRLQMLNI